MSILAPDPSILRSRQGHEHSRVTFVELFFDLVFVFAVTQLSHFLLEHQTVRGTIETLVLFLAVWWVWIDTSWCTNWLDPQRTPVRLMLFALMLAGLVLSTSIPGVREARGLSFAGAYVFMQVGRSLFMLWALRRNSPGNYRNFQRITAWLSFASLFWVAGGLADSDARLVLWIIGLALEFTSPIHGFWTPGLGRSTVADWDVAGSHMAERCGLFMIIALGESILVTGTTFGQHQWAPAAVAAFASAFVGSVAMWWIYFNIGAEVANRRISAATDPGRFARLAYTYIHTVPVAGIIVAAAADDLILAHPNGHVDVKTAATALGGPALFLFGNILFKRAMNASPALSHMIGLVFLALLIPAAIVLSPLQFGAAATLVLVIVAIWETRSLTPHRQELSSV